MIATADIGAEVAWRLVRGWSGRNIVELGSRVSPDDLARALSEVLGRPVQARPIPRERWTAGTEPVAGTITPAQFFAQARNAPGAP